MFHPIYAEWLAGVHFASDRKRIRGRNISEHDADQPSYVPVGTPTEQEIAVMRAEWRTECVELDRELENLRVTWRGKEITTAS